MLGCQDFCGYYEWTFHYLRRKFGNAGLEKYWSQAIALDSQQHYLQAGMDNGLRGLHESWFKTGVDEQCDWSVTLDEEHNRLRLDMRECPSKGFLLENGLNADEDYCDHCIGWIGPALNVIGAEVAAHQHNHCGQCWWEMRMKDRESPPVKVYNDITDDPRWNRGYLDRFAQQIKLPIVDSGDNVDPSDAILIWFQPCDKVVVLGDAPIDEKGWPKNDPYTAVLVTGRRYATGDVPTGAFVGVLVGHDEALLPEIATRFLATPAVDRPLMMHAYLPQAAMLSFVECNLPRPIPILPLLIRSGLYRHLPHEPSPSTSIFALVLAASLNKKVVLPGNVSQDSDGDLAICPTDLAHLQNAWKKLKGNLDLPSEMQS